MIGSSIEALRSGNAKDQAYAKILEGVLEARGKDIPYPKQPAVTSTAEVPTTKQNPIKKENEEGILTQIVREFNKEGWMTPEFVTSAFQQIWKARGESAGLELTVTPCDRTPEELAELAKNGRRIGYLPETLMAQQDRPLLARIFPQLGSHSVQEGNSVTNEVNRSGWFDYESAVDAPYRNTTEDQLRAAIETESKRIGRELAGMNVSEYIVAGEDSKLFTGKYLDHGANTWSRLLGSRRDGRVVRADFDSLGRLDVRWRLGSRYRYPSLGGRSVGVKS